MKSKQLIVALALASFLPQSRAALILGTADSFAVLGSTTVTSTGGTVLNGNLGLSPGTAITGFPPGVVNGTTHAADAVALQALADAHLAYTTLQLQPFIQDLTGQNLGGLTLTPGVRKFDSSAQLTGILTLDAQGNSNARFDFQIGSTLTTASSSSLRLINGAQADNVFWQVGSSATLGTGTEFDGTIIANSSITLNTEAIMFGRALALNGAVTLDFNTITVPTGIPEPAYFWPLALGTMVFGAWKWTVARKRQPKCS
jgi:type VI secretion system secreted protein VgrG